MKPADIHFDRSRRGRRLAKPPARWAQPPRGYPPAHRHENYEFCFALRGRCPFLLGEERILLRAGQLVVLSPRVFHREFAAERAEPYTLLWCSFQKTWMGGHVYAHLGRGRFRSDKLRVWFEGFADGLRAAEAVDLELFEDRPGAFLRVQGLLLAWCGAALRHLEEAGAPAPEPSKREAQQQQRVKAAVDFVRDRFAEPLDLAAVAAHVGIGAGYLSALFTRELGRTFTEFLAACRLEEAERLLRDPALSVKEIAHRVGFENPFYFSRLFRRRTGKSPKQWREI
ncbi:MAG: AraC family transcriptional regulator [Planctomycetota bacterium]|nr:AraC family transcriptional regulator [Planctomycetota bacterium]